MAAKVAPKTIAELVVSEPRFSTLLAAVKAADLVDTLSGEGSFTVFAPTNEAFKKVPEEALTGLLANKEELKAVLLRHVVPGKTVKLYKAPMSYDNAGGSKVTVDGYSVTTSAASARVTGKITATDGMVYAIDTVI